MTPQIFRGRTLDEARRAAQVSLGDEAVIVTTRELRRPALLGLLSRSTFEVAALPPEAPKASATAANAATRSGVFAAANYQRTEATPAFGEEIASLRAEMRREIRGMRQSVAYANTSRESPALEAELEMVRLSLDLLREEAANGRRDASQAFLRELGIEGLAAAMIGRALRGRKLSGDTLRDAVRAAAAELLPVATWPLARENKRLVALVGPTGVGKTTTIAKLAARAVLDHDKTVTLVACDSFRVGAVDHLRRYASLLRVKLQVATSRHDLESIVRDATSDLVLVDTGGRAPDLEAAEGWLASRARRAPRSADDQQPVLDASGRETDVLLCLPAALRARDVTRIAKTFASLHPTALAITKLDETEAPAAIVHGPVTTRLPVSLVTFGQRVPEDLAQATVADLVEALVPVPRSLRAAQG
jgi:flagellar biosynthesis protein FlhF